MIFRKKLLIIIHSKNTFQYYPKLLKNYSHLSQNFYLTYLHTTHLFKLKIIKNVVRTYNSEKTKNFTKYIPYLLTRSDDDSDTQWCERTKPSHLNMAINT